MAKFTLYKHIKINGAWRYFRAAVGSNNKLKPHLVLIDGAEQTHEGGSYCVRNGGKWIDVGNDPAEALRRRSKLMEAGCEPVPATPTAGKTPLKDAAEKYFANCEARGLDADTLRTYHSGIDPFVTQCKKAFVEDVTKQDMIDFMGWLRKQPVPMRLHGNPERTLANRIGYVAIFLKEFGVEKLLKKNERPKYHEKKIVAHPDDELDVLYGSADAEETFLLDFFIGSMARDCEAYGSRYSDLTGTTLTLYGKQHKTRCVPISPRLAEAINARRQHSKSELLFPNGNGKPNQHLLRDLQSLAERAGAKFHTELHKLRKTGASRRYLAGVPLPTLMLELGHNSLATTQRYLADVRREDETKKAVADADFIPKPQVVKTGTAGDD